MGVARRKHGTQEDDREEHADRGSDPIGPDAHAARRNGSSFADSTNLTPCRPRSSELTSAILHVRIDGRPLIHVTQVMTAVRRASDRVAARLAATPTRGALGSACALQLAIAVAVGLTSTHNH